jgi:hypothetical protein
LTVQAHEHTLNAEKHTHEAAEKPKP